MPPRHSAVIPAHASHAWRRALRTVYPWVKTSVDRGTKFPVSNRPLHITVCRIDFRDFWIACWWACDLKNFCKSHIPSHGKNRKLPKSIKYRSIKCTDQMCRLTLIDQTGRVLQNCVTHDGVLKLCDGCVDFHLEISASFPEIAEINSANSDNQVPRSNFPISWTKFSSFRERPEPQNRGSISPLWFRNQLALQVRTASLSGVATW